MKRTIKIRRRDGHVQRYHVGRSAKRRNYGSARFSQEHARKWAFTQKRIGLREKPELRGDFRNKTVTELMSSGMDREPLQKELVRRMIEQEKINEPSVDPTPKEKVAIVNRVEERVGRLFGDYGPTEFTTYKQKTKGPFKEEKFLEEKYGDDLATDFNKNTLETFGPKPEIITIKRDESRFKQKAKRKFEESGIKLYR